ncbi:piggyBac transposable element-derived protein 3-like [Nilaparvata lugens]|uniref:piggyBac transposable element-derived protein 3-like n=1 Tax=Nilaparvata lugens TaxID=108931 RepID=UPI00193D8C3D|nr:piggyBac transposable element-derived protein 3-like [Nilaparvata lugens]
MHNGISQTAACFELLRLECHECLVNMDRLSESEIRDLLSLGIPSGSELSDSDDDITEDEIVQIDNMCKTVLYKKSNDEFDTPALDSVNDVDDVGLQCVDREVTNILKNENIEADEHLNTVHNTYVYDEPNIVIIRPSRSRAMNNLGDKQNLTSEVFHDIPNNLDNDDIREEENVAPNKSVKKSYRDLMWTKGNKVFSNDNEFTGDTNIPDTIRQLKTPYGFFRYIIDDSVFDLIISETLKYSLFKDINKPFKISMDELKRYFGILIMTSIVKLNNVRLYWNSNLGNHIIIKAMTVNRFEQIRSFLHFNDLTSMPDRDSPQFDRLYRLRPIIEHLNEKFSSIPMEEHFAVDEQICATKAHHQIKTYNPMKPHKWGFKNYVLCGVSGYAYRFEFYTGQENSVIIEPDLGACANIVKRLSLIIPHDKNHKLFCDNYFTTVGLLVHLHQKGVLCVGTIRKNRFPNLNLPNEKDLKKSGRGTSIEHFSNVDGTDVSVVGWFDNKLVALSSTYVGENPKDTVTRFDRKNKKKIEIERPAIVKEYNRFMGGVDLMDMIMGINRATMRTKKWYFRIFYHSIDMSIINAWLLFRRVYGKSITITHFREQVAITLCKSGDLSEKPKRGRPSQKSLDQLICKKKRGPKQPVPTLDTRTDGIGHIRKFLPNRVRCKHPKCKKQTFTFCEKCEVSLCSNKKNDCFADYHSS